MKNGRSTKHRTCHLNVKYFFARKKIADGSIRLAYKSTKDIVADLLTNPCDEKLLDTLISVLMGH